MLHELPPYDSVKLVSLLKQCGNYRDQLAMIVHFLHRTGALGVYQNWLDNKLNVDPQPLQEGEPPPSDRPMTQEEINEWDAIFKQPILKRVTVTHDQDEVARLFCEKLNELHRYGISCEEVANETNTEYNIQVEREDIQEEEIKAMVNQHMTARPAVGVALCIRRDHKVLLHKRKGKHAPGAWAFTGGHLEKFEDFEQAALRETAEEAGTDLKVTNVRFWTASNTKFHDEGKHYVVIFMIADWVSGEAKVMEPDKCECWEWHAWDALPEPLMLGLLDLKARKLSPFGYLED